jgi:hypothetical protein
MPPAANSLRRPKNLEKGTFEVWSHYNPLKSHETAKGIFEKLGEKGPRFGKAWKKAWSRRGAAKRRPWRLTNQVGRAARAC